MKFDRKVYFDAVRKRPFGGSLSQQQVDGQNAILDRWEKWPLTDDLRWLAYPLATALHETASTMQPIEEYGKGAGHSYGVPDVETGQTYYGRGYVQLTWRDNYARAANELDLTGGDDLEWHADRALDPTIAANVMFTGMADGWFRHDSAGTPETLGKYFDDETDDPFNAREIINGDRNTVPSWSGGKSIGSLIAGYHEDFLAALQASVVDAEPEPQPGELVVTIKVDVPAGVVVKIEQTEH
jgi:hypothetical protein